MKEITRALDLGMILLSIGLVIKFLNSPAECRNASMSFELIEVISGFILVSYGMRRLEEAGLYYVVSGIGVVILGFALISAGC